MTGIRSSWIHGLNLVLAFSCVALLINTPSSNKKPKGWDGQRIMDVTHGPNEPRNVKYNDNNTTKQQYNIDYDDSTALIGKWRRQVQSANGGILFFKHIRKAGGTSLRRYLDNAINYTRQSMPSSNIAAVEQEFSAMPWNCSVVDSRWEKTLSIVSLRNPIDRHLSEFFYSGPPRECQGQKKKTVKSRWCELVLTKNYTHEFYTIMNTKILPWIKEGVVRVRKKRSLDRHFTDDFQVRAFVGETDVTPNDNGNCSGLSDKRDCSKGVCVYGGAYEGAKYPMELTKVELSKAKKALDQFDVVLLTETMMEQETAEFLSNVFDVPLNVSSMPRRNPGETHEDLVLSGMVKYMPQTVKLLKEHSQLEVALYRHAVELNSEMMKQWRNEQISVT